MPLQPRLSRRQLVKISLATAFAVRAVGAGGLRAQEDILAGRDLRTDKRPILHPDGLRFGCYDPYGDFSEENRVATEHLFLPWEDVDLSSLPAADDYAQARGRNVLVTIEPWSWAQDWNVSSAQLRELVLSGQRDANMRAICQVLATFRSPIVVRWAQEMDNPYNRFTWSDWSPADYIEAFRRMRAIAHETLPSARMMWSPRGEMTLQQFYPGDEHVDLIGLTVFGLEEYDIRVYGQPRTFEQSVRQGYELTAVYGKPVWVAELGYEGRLEYLADWVTTVTAHYPQYPLLEEVVYFNDREVWEWPLGLGWPNWRVIRDGPTYPVRR